jgi:hypothetical protein
LVGLLFHNEDGSSLFLRNVREFLLNCTDPDDVIHFSVTCFSSEKLSLFCGNLVFYLSNRERDLMGLCNEMRVNVETLSSIETLHDRLVESNHGKTEAASGPSVEELLLLTSHWLAKRGMGA